MEERLNLNPDVLRFLYIDKQLSTRDIAKLFDCHYTTIQRYLRKWNIPTRDYSESQKIRDKEVVISKEDVSLIQKLVKQQTENTLEAFLTTLEDIPDVKYTPSKHQDINIVLPIKCLNNNKKLNATLTLVFSDLHLGHSDFLPNTFYSCIENVKRVLKTLKKKFNIKRFILVGNGDLVSGREVYRFQVLQNLLQRGHWQVFLAEKILKELIDDLNSIIPISSVYLCKGTHESLSENYLLYLKKALLSLGIDTHYLSHAKILNIAEPIGNYNVLFTHGKGKSDYYPISYAMIRDLWKTISGYKSRDIPIERVCVGHSHWLTTNLILEGIVLDETGGFQRWEYTISQRPCGMILYFYCNNEVSAIPIRPDFEIEDLEKHESALEYKNLKFYGKKLLEHFEEIEKMGG